MNENKKWDIGEFVSYELISNETDESFTIVLNGPKKYENLIANRVGTIEITEEEYNEWCSED